MGRLVTLSDLGLPPIWFFDDVYYSTDTSTYKYAWPNPSFKYQVCMFDEYMSKTSGLKSLIRRWIENTISDTVIIDTLNYDYKKFYGKSYEWEKHRTISNKWHRFSFENSHSCSMFSLAFSEYIKPMTKWHPNHPEDEEYLNRPLEERYIK